MPPHAHCRFYEQKYPEVEDVVMVKVRQIAEMGGTFDSLDVSDCRGAGG
jgi:translation initiation factor 2 subunit 1